jgi:hypothetical protein
MDNPAVQWRLNSDTGIFSMITVCCTADHGKSGYHVHQQVRSKGYDRRFVFVPGKYERRWQMGVSAPVVHAPVTSFPFIVAV